MNKQKADKILTEYLPKIYGFAVKKSFSYDEEEEICADIVKELYESLLKSKEIYNLDGYVWRISEYVYSKYVSFVKRHQGVSLDQINLSVKTSTISEIMRRNFCACAEKLHFSRKHAAKLFIRTITKTSRSQLSQKNEVYL